MLKRLFYIIATSVFVSVTGGYAAVGEDGNQNENEDATPAENTDNMSSEQLLQWLVDKTEECRNVSKKVQRMLDQARKVNDTVRIDCLDDKLSQINAELRGMEERADSLNSEITANGTANLEVFKVQVDRVKGLGKEAENCIGEKDIVLGATEVEVVVEEGGVEMDPSQEKVETDFSTDQYEHASGYY